MVLQWIRETVMGFSWSAFAAIGKLVAPIILASVGVPPALTPLILHGIELAELAGHHDSHVTGAQKKAIAMDAISTGLAAVNAAKPGTVDTAAVTGLVSQGIDLTVAAINEGKNIPVQPVPPSV